MEGLWSSVKEGLRFLGEMVQSDDLNCDFINGAIDSAQIDNKVKVYMKQHPKESREQAYLQVLYDNGLLSAHGYKVGVEDLKKKNKWVN